MRHCLLHTVRHEGVRGLYKGMVPSLLITAPYLSVCFSTYDELKACPPGAGTALQQLSFEGFAA
jgi:hypothetical protein